MSQVDPPAPGQTIIIEKRERVSVFRRLLTPLLLLFLLLMVFRNFLSLETGFPTRLSERYHAGDLGTVKVAIVEVDGLILGKEVEHILKQIRQARDDDQVRAVILRIDSPGGGVSGSDQIWRELTTLNKPVVASLGGTAASGGYYIAARGDRVLAEPTTITGSIGVILELPQIGGLLEKLGVRMETVTTGEWKDSGSIFHTHLDPKERKRWGQVIDSSYQRFVRIVAQGRKLPLETVRPLADGRVFTADEALQNGLIDRIGYLDDAIKEAWNLARLESSRVIRYARPLSLTESLLSLSAPKPDFALDARNLLTSQVPQLLYLAR